MKLCILGLSRSGKDEAAQWFSTHTNLRYKGTASTVISKEIARMENITFEEAHAMRHKRKMHWKFIGDEIREFDKAALSREVLKGSDLLVGIRSLKEIEQVKIEGLCDLYIWVARAGLPEDPTIEFGSEVCDIVMENHWGIKEYHNRLKTLAKMLKLI